MVALISPSVGSLSRCALPWADWFRRRYARIVFAQMRLLEQCARAPQGVDGIWCFHVPVTDGLRRFPGLLRVSPNGVGNGFEKFVRIHALSFAKTSHVASGPFGTETEGSSNRCFVPTRTPRRSVRLIAGGLSCLHSTSVMPLKVPSD
jgi:hypothetical protein